MSYRCMGPHVTCGHMSYRRMGSHVTCGHMSYRCMGSNCARLLVCASWCHHCDHMSAVRSSHVSYACSNFSRHVTVDTCMRTDVQTHEYTSYIHTCTPKGAGEVHTCILTFAQTHMLTHTCMHQCLSISEGPLSKERVLLAASMYIYIYIHTHTQTCAYVYVRIYTHTHTHPRTKTHTHTHTHIWSHTHQSFHIWGTTLHRKRFARCVCADIYWCFIAFSIAVGLWRFWIWVVKAAAVVALEGIYVFVCVCIYSCMLPHLASQCYWAGSESESSESQLLCLSLSRENHSCCVWVWVVRITAVCTHVSMYVHVCVCMHKCMYVHMCVWMYTCACVCIYMSLHISSLGLRQGPKSEFVKANTTVVLWKVYVCVYACRESFKFFKKSITPQHIHTHTHINTCMLILLYMTLWLGSLIPSTACMYIYIHVYIHTCTHTCRYMQSTSCGEIWIWIWIWIWIHSST